MYDDKRDTTWPQVQRQIEEIMAREYGDDFWGTVSFELRDGRICRRKEVRSQLVFPNNR